MPSSRFSAIEDPGPRDPIFVRKLRSGRLSGMRALFVCRQNRCRSRAAEEIFRVLTWNAEGQSHYEVRSAGTKAHPRGHQISTRDVDWADVICVMEQEQEAHIRNRWPAQADKIRVLGIPDIYQPHDATLEALLTDVVRTLLAEERPRPAIIDSAPSGKPRLRSGGPRRWNGVLTGRRAGAVAALVVVMTIAGYLMRSWVEPEHPVSIPRTSNGPDPFAVPSVTAEAGTPERRAIPSDETASAVPVATRPIGPVRPPGSVESPMPPNEGLNTRSADVFADLPPPPAVPPPPERLQPPVALPPPATLSAGRSEARGRPVTTAESTGVAVEVVRPAPAGRPGSAGGASREGADGSDPGAIIEWVLREYPARK